MRAIPFLAIGYIIGLLMAVIFDMLGEAQLITEKKSEWRCVEYMPDSAECAVYERVGRPRE